MNFTKETFEPKLKPDELMIVSMIALSGMIICLIASAVYLVGWVADTIIFKWIIGVNAFFGVLFLGSNLYGIYTQFKMMDAMKGLNDLINVDSLINVEGGNLNGKK